LNMGHVVTMFGQGRAPTFEEWCLRHNKMKRRVELTVPNFLSAPFLLMGTDRIATMHRRLARRLADRLPLKYQELPFEMPKIKMAAHWHRTSENDPCINWVISQLKEISDGKDMLQNVNQESPEQNTEIHKIPAE